ncbi:helix-turn-helix domain-containing protein [Sinosporangium siamense]|uniref:Excisionase n=1 Tax=Sinosporangium siamense TaxID=1367973 RepID=A0A919VG91_9ACTN|nr:helix-turn-helix domain-containing protein [Sinosporangium siamense]GII96874.1 excisionase [Sinosporangium siamense]
MSETTIQRADERRLYRVDDAVHLLSLSRSVIYELIRRAGRLLSVKQGRTRLIPASAISAYEALLVQEASGA